jgi:hypothetical protein
MDEKRDDENAAIRFLVDEFRGLKNFVEGHCRDEETNNKQILGQITTLNQAQIKMSVKQAGFESDIKQIHGGLGEIKADLKPLVTTVAVHDKDLRDAEGDIQNLYGMVGDARDRIRDSKLPTAATAGKKTIYDFMISDSFKWLVVPSMIVVVIAIVYGVVTSENVTSIVP